MIRAGPLANLTAAERDLTINGSTVTGNNVSLNAKGNVRLEAGENTSITTTENKFSSASIGASFAPSGLTDISISANKGNGDSKETLTAYSPALVSAQNDLTLTSGKDMDIIGSKTQGEKITAKIGGNLNVETLQEKETYEEDNHATGFGVSWNVNQTKKETTDANGDTKIETLRSFSKPTFSGSWNKGNIDSHYRSARDQAGFFAGSKGFDIYVEKNTDLKGGIIASNATPDKNHLSTGTFSFSDLKNEADYSAKSIGASYHKYGNYKNMEKEDRDAVYNTIGLAPNISMPAKGDADSTTKSAVAIGTIDIRENPTQDISALSRDTANSLNELGRIFDKAKIEEQQELAAVFGEEAFRLLHNMKDDGSGRKIAAHAIIGGLMSQITGAGFASGAIGAGLNEALIKALDGKDPGTAQIISAIIGAAAAKVAGGNALAGASAAASGTKWNKYEKLPRIKEQLEHLPEQEIYQSLRDGDYILLYDFEENRYSVCIAVNNKGEAWDIPLGDHGYKVKIPESGYVPYTVYDGNVTGAQQDDMFRDRKYIGKLIPAAGSPLPLKQKKDKNTEYKSFSTTAHERLDLIGYVPGPIGSVASIADGILYAADGNYSAAILSTATILPGVKYVKAGRKALKELPILSKAEKLAKEKMMLTSSGKFKDADLENGYLTYIARKDKQGKPPRDRIDWKEAHDYWLYDSPMARGNAFNKMASKKEWYPYDEVHLANGKRVDSYDPVKKEIISRKATDLEMIDVKTFEQYLKELRDKYPAGAKIRSDKYPEIDGQHLQGKQILEIPASNKNFERIKEYEAIAEDYKIEIRFREE